MLLRSLFAGESLAGQRGSQGQRSRSLARVHVNAAWARVGAPTASERLAAIAFGMAMSVLEAIGTESAFEQMLGHELAHLRRTVVMHHEPLGRR